MDGGPVEFQDAVALAAQAIEGIGVAVILVGCIAAGASTAFRVARGRETGAYEALRRTLGRAILLGLELLVGADIIRTVAEKPTIERVAVLGLIVLIRTFLSFSLQLEVDGRWPWQEKPK